MGSNASATATTAASVASSSANSGHQIKVTETFN